MSPSKAADDTRKQQSVADDHSSTNKTPAPKAWTTGTNPITQRSNGTTPVNGMTNGHTQEQTHPNMVNNQHVDKHAHDRLLFLFANFVGLDAVLVLNSGQRYSGVFSGAAAHGKTHCYHLKMVRRLGQTDQANGDTLQSHPLIGEGDEHAMSFDIADTADLQVQRVNLGSEQSRATNGAGFRTDVEISGNLDMRERNLQRWEPGPADVDMSLGNDDSIGTSGAWDQFAANEKLYNVRSDYDESIYTTAINKSDPKYRQLAEQADRLAREMERDQDAKRSAAPADSGLDEEDKYSGVRREQASFSKSGPNAYVPPSKRPITNKPTVSGAPFDPAIISSQLARSNDAQSPASTSKQTESAVPADAASQPAKEAAPSRPSAAVNGIAQKPAAKRDQAVPEPATAASAKAAADNGANTMRNVLDAFKQFNQSEKLRIQQQQRQHQQQRATHARQEKSVKLNDLKKFSQNFKLTSRVPDDLVPILAKSKEKQDLIVAKADQQAREKEVRADPAKSESSKTVSQRGTPVAKPSQNEMTPPLVNRARSQQTGKDQATPAQLSRPQASFNARNHMPHRQPPNGAVPSPIPIPQTIPQGDHGITSPTSATSARFNVKAMEFRPNPAASMFTPTGPETDASASKRPSIASSVPSAPAAVPVVDFFTPSSKKSKLAEGSWEETTSTCFSTVARLFAVSDESKRAQFAANGGIPQGYRTAPVWDVVPANQERSYVDFFQKVIQPSPSPLHGPQSGPMPHQHQLPLHLQNGGPNMPQTPPFYRGQSQHGPQHLDDGRMPSYATASAIQPSPRMGQPALAFNGQPHHQVPGYPYLPANGMGPAMTMRQLPNGAGYITPQGQPIGGHMMMQQQPSNGPYMQHPGQQQMHMYPSPGPAHVQPHFAGHPAQPGLAGGYAGSPRAHPMSHQGSQQGHGPQPMMMMQGQGGPMMMMPQYGSPMGQIRYGQQPHFPGQHPGAYAMQQRAMSSGGYSQHMTPRQQHAVPHQGHVAPQMHPSASTNGEDGR